MAKKSHGTQSLLQFTNCFSGWHCSQFFTVLGRYLHRFCSTILLKIKIYKSYDRLCIFINAIHIFRPQLKFHVTNCMFTKSLLPCCIIVSTAQPAQNQSQYHILFHKNCSPLDLYSVTLTLLRPPLQITRVSGIVTQKSKKNKCYWLSFQRWIRIFYLFLHVSKSQ